MKDSLGAPPPFDRSAALFLDLDGTIAEIEPRPDQVAAAPMRSALLVELGRRMGGRVAILSGRTLDDVDRILEGSVAAVAAVHGLVRRRPDGSIEQTSPSPALEAARGVFTILAEAQRGLIVEDKTVSVTLHYRQVPQVEAAVCEAAERIATSSDLVLQQGAMVAELRTPGPTKGDCLRAFLAEPPFEGHAPVMVGDDLTDEHAFEAAKAAGGYGVLVGPERGTHASYRLETVADVLDWLGGQ